MGQNKYYIRIKALKRRGRLAQAALCLLLCLFPAFFFSCLDENLVSTTRTQVANTDETPMYLRVSIPNTYSGTGDVLDDKETVINTLDMLVFERGVGDNDDKYFVKSAGEGHLIDPITSKTRFQVLMPIGEGLRVHLFINCHEQLKKKNFFNSPGKEMNAMLQQLVVGESLNKDTQIDLPMHGFMNDVNIRKESANSEITIPVLRSVSAAQIMVKAVQKDDDYTTSALSNFDLRSFYVFFQADSGRVAPKLESYKAPLPDKSDLNITRSVKDISLLEKPQVIDVKHPDSVFNETPVTTLPPLYFYENKAWTPTGYDLPTEANNYATTRLVVGGVYDNMLDSKGNPKVTYYRIDFAKDDNIIDILRNNKHIFSIESVSGPGYDTPEQAATGVPINITVNVIEWDNNFGYVLFDRENHFYVETKRVDLHRARNSYRIVRVESNIEAKFWKMNFATAVNGATTPSTVNAKGETVPTTSNTLQNSRYKVEKKETELIITALKDFKDLPAGESRSDILVLQAKNLTLRVNLNQLDISPDDWGDGGNIDSGLAGE
ncbi:MAG: fimbrial protein [Bacteroides xylanisolvens]